MRRSHGYDQPHAVKYWCVGNEMDGPWQIGHMPAREYGIKATDAARQMRVLDPSIKLIACGSSGPFMPTYIEWDRTVLEECYDEVDGISLHRYWGNTEENNNDSSKYLAMNCRYCFLPYFPNTGAERCRRPRRSIFAVPARYT